MDEQVCWWDSTGDPKSLSLVECSVAAAKRSMGLAVYSSYSVFDSANSCCPLGLSTYCT